VEEQYSSCIVTNKIALIKPAYIIGVQDVAKSFVSIYMDVLTKLKLISKEHRYCSSKISELIITYDKTLLDDCEIFIHGEFQITSRRDIIKQVIAKVDNSL